MKLIQHVKILYSQSIMDYGVTCGLILLSAVWYKFSPLGLPFLDIALALVAFYRAFIHFDRENFSWKYLQSLPLEKDELLKFHIVKTFFNSAPLVLWVLVFLDLLLEILAEFKEISAYHYVIAFFCIFFLIAFSGLQSFRMMIEATRAPYARRNHKFTSLQNLRDTIFGLTALLYGLLLFAIGNMAIEHLWPGLLKLIAGKLDPIWNVWTFFSFAAAFTFFQYSLILRHWQNEASSYRKPNWFPRRDVPLMIICFALVAAPIKLLLNQTPDLYGNLKANDYVYHADYPKLENVLNDKNELNRSSETGFTPLMVAAHTGNQELFNKLLQSGASMEGKVNYPKDKFLHQRNLFHLSLIGKNIVIVEKLLSDKNLNESINGVGPLHIASWNCSPQIIDLLILKGAHLNEVNKSGKTPLHIAAENNCLKGAMALLESGADSKVKDKDGKLAFDYAKLKDNDLAYYLEKKSRSPAGKK